MEIPEIAKNNSRKKKQELSDTELLKQTAEGVVEITRILSDMSRDLKINAMNNQAFVPSYPSSPFFPTIPPTPVGSPVYHKPENMLQNAPFCKPIVAKYAELSILHGKESTGEKWDLCWRKPHLGLPISSPTIQYFIDKAIGRPDEFANRLDVRDFYKLTIRLSMLNRFYQKSLEPYVLDITFTPMSLEMIIGDNYSIRDVIKVTELIKQRATAVAYATMPVPSVVVGENMGVNDDEPGKPIVLDGSVYVSFTDVDGTLSEASCGLVENIVVLELKDHEE